MEAQSYTAEERRAANQVWAAAGAYGFEPLFLARNTDGTIDFYMNCIVGLVHKYYGDALVRSLFDTWEGDLRQTMLDDLSWLYLESAAYALELPGRPVLSALRRAHADYFFGIQYKLSRQEWMAKNQLVYSMQAARWRAVQGRTPPVMTPYEKSLSAALSPETPPRPEELKAALLAVYAKFERDPSEVYIGTSSVEEVCFASDRGYGIEDIETFVVPYGSRCTISVGDDLFFEGFYDGWNRETATRLTAQTSYTFTATEDRNIVPHYLRVQNLSAAGTANCYIAPKAGAAYSFNARTMGNGRMTTGITPRTLYGSRAEVLWESSAYAGSVRGAVIAAAEYRDGQIRFRTGTEAGNALIGLFDSNDNCIWSWHIWVTAYDPAASAQTYTGGAVFMDRNLGAASITDPGLYYQWGRKEPFGASYTRVTYHEDHPYDITDPMMGYGEMTLAYSIAHPWTFMCGVAMNDDRYEDTSDWLASQNPNLWGNASSATALADAGSKSIYDPCPPGWRVPDRRTFAEAAISKNTGGLSDACYSMRINTSGMCANYSRGGYLMDGTQYNPDKAALVWTNAPAQYQTGVNYYKHYSTALKIYPAAVEPLARISRDMALPVRCVRE